ncbi:Lysophospholipid transporter LplT [Stieleria neptunia]|uniref:Lysophospholipid transporter LplT n=1 Tax=Stieleria neptunia TaxID=2527979 RepID=A0A518I1E3_9BACT|nr:MFS transporter [Stieleria neptunia]QDV46898.1 Lysophospholipid transporter LplT [Stieleria neptunia]
MKEPSDKLFNAGFLGLMVAQFFGAMNDNLLKVILAFAVVRGVWEGRLGDGGEGIVSVCFTLPFLLLSGFAGQIADRYSKRTVTLWVKIAEIPIALLAGIGFYFENLYLALLALVALTCQSSFFGPAKYGMIPELVSDKNLSRANGSINMMTNIAVILGTVIAGSASVRYHGAEDVARVAWLPGALFVGTAILGFVASLLITRLQPGQRDLNINYNPFVIYVDTIKKMGRTRLLTVMMAWGYFYLLAGLALSTLFRYPEVLSVGDDEASVLMGVLGIAIGLGCAIAGFISGDRIEPRLTTIGAAGLVIFFFLLAAVPPWMPDARPMIRVALSNVAFFIFFAGFFAGFYIIPLQALLQKLSPDDERGQFLGTANAVSFAFMTVAGLLYWAVMSTPAFNNRPQRMFYVSSGLMLAGSLFFLWKLRGTGILIGSKPNDQPDG